MNWQEHHSWAGVFLATLCPFQDDESIDKAGLQGYIRELANVDGVKGLVRNGHTGEMRHCVRASVRA